MHKLIKATFTQQRTRNNERVRLICNETGGVYVITPAPFGFNIFCNGWKFAERSTMCHALNCLQQDAELAVRSECHA
jgi:hypothetical protein